MGALGQVAVFLAAAVVAVPLFRLLKLSSILGYVAEHWGIRWSFGIGLPLVVLSFFVAGALGSRPIKHEVD